MVIRKPRVLFYFLHLLGVGHVHRARRLIEAMADHGIAVDAVFGGAPISDLKLDADSLHYLPPIRAADNAYSAYLDEHGKPLEKPYLEKRNARLLGIFKDLEPDAILIEAFPFGRRMVRMELLSLLETAAQRKRRPVIISSVRDILQEKRKPGRAEETRDLVQTRFDHVLVHADPAVVRLDETFPLASDIEEKLHYTGFVVPPSKVGGDVTAYDIIVSAGGGAFGGALMKTAMELAMQDPFPGLRWCFTTGPNLAQDQFDELQRAAPGHVAVVRNISNLADHMQQAKLSISQCGYNTAMDVLSVHETSDCRALLVPYDTEGQTEQLRRADLLQKAGYAINLPQSALTHKTLHQAAQKALSLPRVDRRVNFDGARNSARLMAGWLNAKSRP